MKTLFFLAVLSISSAHATNFLLESTCTGLDMFGSPVSVSVHVDEDMYCDNEPKESYATILVVESKEAGPGQNVYLAKNLPLASESEDGYIVSTAMVDGKEVEAIILKHNLSKEASYKVVSDILEDGSVAYEEVTLKCSSIHYDMRCDQ